MANNVVLDLDLLRGSTPQGQAIYLRNLRNSHPDAESSITPQLIALVASDSLPSIALSLWPSASKDPQTTIAVIRQEQCLNVHQAAIKRFYRLLCKEKTFAKTWEAAGGAAGVAQLMAKLSVSNVRVLVKWLGVTGRSQGARRERHRAMEELLTLLWGLDGGENVVLDSRPLRDEYIKILPACGGAFQLQWRESKRQLHEYYHIAVETDHEFFEKYYDEKLQRNEIKASEFLTEVQPLVIHRTQYGLDMLDRFIDSETLLGASPDDLLDAVIYPLSKRFLSRRRIATDTAMRFWGRVVLCLKERQPFHKEFKNSSDHYKRILARLVKVWNHSRGRTEYAEILTELFPLIPETVLKKYSLVDLIKNVAQTRRYQLLRLFLKHTVGCQFDIGEPLGLVCSGLDKSSIQWHPELFSLLPADEAFALWEKVQRAGKDVKSWERDWTSDSIYFCQDQDDSKTADYLIIRAYLLRQSQATSPFTAAELDTMRSDLCQEVSRRMKKATQGRLPEMRSKWAVAALELCVAIGDLELYGETLRWARRFNKDPLTVQQIYGEYSLATKEVADLVTVLPAKESPPVHVEELSQRIQSANDDLQILFDTAMMSINEPSFRGWSDWGPVFVLINRVICKRIDHVNDFQDRAKMSDDALYEALWKPTFAMLEKMLPHQHILAPEGEMKFGPEAYSSLYHFQAKEPETLREPTIRFLDQLAEYEDSIWKEFRLRQTPALVTADEIWPKGLTIQHLCYNFALSLPYLPYAQSRIEAIVFTNPLKALQPIQVDEETQLAIGTSIDSWAAALQQYIWMPGKLPEEEQRKERISRAWHHATVDLSEDRMSLEEAERFWWPVFEEVGVNKDEVGINEEADQRHEPSLPDADEDTQPIEWNPDPEYERISQTEKSKTLTPTCLDVLLSRPKYWYLYDFTSTEEDSEVWNVKCVIPGKPRPLSFWDSFSTTYSELTCKHVDAYVVAGILALNMKKGSDISLQKKPFPNSGAVRIPAVYLDQEFLEREVDTQVSGFTRIIDHFKYYVPASLFAQLGASVLESIRRGTETDKPYGTLVWIINRLLEGASPSMAIPLIQQFVLENPDASSWHRPLLNPKALINFRPADAKHFFETFTDAILDKLQEQAERRAKQEPGEASANKGPLVKVTTVKMLAQLLRESPVVDPDLAVELNIKILKRASHVDIRTAAVKGLTQSIASTTDPEVKKRIFDALLKYAAPIASSINESQPLTDWDALTSDDELPEIWKSSDGTLETPTIMDLILNIGFKQDWKSEEGRAYKELIYTIMDASAENHKRWMKLFIKKHGFTMPDDAQLPAIPMFPTALETLLRVMKTETSAKYVETAKQYLLLRIGLPDWVSAITDAVRADRKLVSSNSGGHWGYLWNHDYDRLTKSLLQAIRLHIVELEKKKTNDEKTQQEDSHQLLEAFLFEIADIIIMQGNLNKFEEFVSDTLTATRDSAVWGRILERIDSLRTPAWQADQNRKPAVLPDTLSLKIRMLNPSLSAPEPDKIQDVATRCATRAVKLLNDIVASGVPYQNSLNALQRELMNAEPNALIAIMIGSTPAIDDPNGVTLVDHLRVQLAMALLDRSWIFRQSSGKTNKDDVLKQGEELVMKLSRSSVENFRNLAASLKAIIENTEGWDLFS